MKKIFSLTATVLLMILILTGCTGKRVKLDLSDMQGPETKILLDGKEYSKDKDEFFKMLENIEDYNKSSVNETPVNVDNYHTFEIENAGKKRYLHVYAKKNIVSRYYIEMPYEGIWNIDSNLYEKLID